MGIDCCRRWEMGKPVLLLVLLAGCAYVPNDGHFSFYSTVASKRGGTAIVIVKIENGTSEDARIVSHCLILEDNMEVDSRRVETFVPKNSVREFTVSHGRMDKGSVGFSCKHYRRNR